MKKLFLFTVLTLIFACSDEENSPTGNNNNNSNRKKLSSLVQVSPCINCEGSNGTYTYTNNKLTYIDIDYFTTNADGSYVNQYDDFMAFEYSSNSVTLNYGGDISNFTLDADGKIIDNDIVFNNGYIQNSVNVEYNWSNDNLISIQEYRDNGDLYSNTLIEYSDFDDLSGYLGLTIALDNNLYSADYHMPYTMLGLLGKSTRKFPKKHTFTVGSSVYVYEHTYVFDDENYLIKLITNKSTYENNILIKENTRQTELTYID